MNNKKLAIFANSNNYSDFHHMLSIIMAAISNEMEINVFFSYGALDKLIKIKNNNINFNSNNKIENYFHKALRKKNIQLKSIKNLDNIFQKGRSWFCLLR